MGINGIGAAGYQTAGYGTRKAERSVPRASFATQAAQTIVQTSPAALHGDDEETGDIAVFAEACLVSDSSITVYKTQDFDPDNPVYKVKVWDKDGNVTERMVDVSKVSPTNCDTVEMYAYLANLVETGQGSFEDTVVKAGIAKHLEQENYGTWSFSTKMNWVDIVKDIMQQQYDVGYLKGYMEWKWFLGLLER